MSCRVRSFHYPQVARVTKGCKACLAEKIFLVRKIFSEAEKLFLKMIMSSLSEYFDQKIFWIFF